MICIVQNKWKIRLQLTKPVTWPPLVWGVVCGAAASGTLLIYIYCGINIISGPTFMLNIFALTWNLLNLSVCSWTCSWGLI